LFAIKTKNDAVNRNQYPILTFVFTYIHDVNS
jgi:hypothetical protein